MDNLKKTIVDRNLLGGIHPGYRCMIGGFLFELCSGVYYVWGNITTGNIQIKITKSI